MPEVICSRLTSHSGKVILSTSERYRTKNKVNRHSGKSVKSISESVRFLTKAHSEAEGRFPVKRWLRGKHSQQCCTGDMRGCGNRSILRSSTLCILAYSFTHYSSLVYQSSFPCLSRAALLSPWWGEKGHKTTAVHGLATWSVNLSMYCKQIKSSKTQTKTKTNRKPKNKM